MAEVCALEARIGDGNESARVGAETRSSSTESFLVKDRLDQRVQMKVPPQIQHPREECRVTVITEWDGSRELVERRPEELQAARANRLHRPGEMVFRDVERNQPNQL
jgi:hypothetical protein